MFSKNKSKFKKGFFKEYKSIKAYREYLKKEYNIDNTDNVVVVEKKNRLIPYLKLIGYILVKGVRLSLNILLFILASLGLLVLIYPNTREQLMYILTEMLEQLKIML